MVETMEFATANLLGGTHPMITLVFGDENSAVPTPAAPSAAQTAHSGVLTCAKPKNSSVSEHTPMPQEASLYAGI